MPRSKFTKPSSTIEDNETTVNKFNKYFTSVGRLTAIKANRLIQEQRLDLNQEIEHESITPAECFSFKSEPSSEFLSVSP